VADPGAIAPAGRGLTRIALAIVASAALGLPASAQSPRFEPNYDESRVAPYTLPDPLVMLDGTRVVGAAQWRARRAEILRLLETTVYGRTPATHPPIRFAETLRDEWALGGVAVRREIAVRLTDRPDGPTLHLLLYLPKRAPRPVPVFLGLNPNGNQAVHGDPRITLARGWMRQRPDNGVVGHRATERSRGVDARQWPLHLILSRGYGVATFYYGDVFPDHPDGLPFSIIPHLYRAGQTAPAPHDWNAIGAWAFGLSRALDYLERDRAVDARRVAVFGHSRLGKVALWAGAQDERFALVIAVNSGEGGAALARRNFGETLAYVSANYPHWFNARYRTYGDRVGDLPVDQHMVIALIAPRPVYVASAAQDLWSDPRGEFLSALAASPVYRLLGTDGLGVERMPGVEQPVMTTVGYHIRSGKSDVTRYDWERFLAFADRHLRR
jgi:hypothetical protein